MYKFSILIPAYKALFLEECITSVLNQTYRNFEIIVLNDSSPEDIDTIVCKFNDNRLLYHKHSERVGSYNLVKTWNHCLELSSGDYIICMGDDDKLCPNCLEQFASLIDKHPEIRVFHTRAEIIDEKNNTVSICEAHPETESVYEFIYNILNFRNRNVIGDFCFEKTSLKDGFVFFPHAWHSDKITVLQQASIAGIAHTNNIGFQYRENRFSITSTLHTEEKIKATNLANEWYVNFFSSPPQKKEDLIFFNLAKELLNKYIKTATSGDLQKDIQYNLIHSFKWFFLRQKYSISLRCYLTALFYACIIRTYKLIGIQNP